LAFAHLLAGRSLAHFLAALGLPPLQLRQLLNGPLQTLLPLPRGTFARRLLTGRQRRLRGQVHLLAHLLDVLARRSQQLLQPFRTAKTACPGADPLPHPVLAHAAHLHHLLIHQRGNPLREKIV
jgi:hypothetical protein